MRYFLIPLCIQLISCVTAPIQEMTDARLAVKAAHDVKALIYVQNTLAKAEDSLTQAEESLRTGQLIQARKSAVLAKQQAINAHKMAIAIDYAKTVWQAVAAVKFSGYDMHRLIKRAEVAAQQEDIDHVLQFAQEAQRQGELALNQAYLEQTAILLCHLAMQEDNLTADALATLKIARIAYQQQEGARAYQLAKPLVDELSIDQNACSIKSHKQ